MQIQINGQAHTCADACHLEDIVLQLGYEGKRIAIERNGEIVPRSQYAHTVLNDGDVLELVVAVGGG